jgi:uncharacterized protein YndB with AHSA1/START domain
MSADVRERHATGATPYRDPNDLRLGGFIDASTFRFVRDYPHPPAMVWAALTEPTQLGVWLWPCRSFEPRLGGVGVFDPGKELVLTVTEFEPERLLVLSDRIRFALAPLADGCQLTVDLTRPDDGWSPMALAGFHGWLGRLSRLLARRPQEETEAWALGIWNAVIGHCEWEVSRCVAGGAPAIWRIHFDENDAGLTPETAERLDELAALLVREDLAVTIDGFGDDPVSADESLRLCAARVEATKARLQAAGVSRSRIHVGFVLGNYHYMVEHESAAGRAYNRRLELRPLY